MSRKIITRKRKDKMKKFVVDIPRSLFYYHYFPFFKVFFERLGAEIFVSATTNKNIVEEGMTRLIEEVCFPVKVFCGHMISISKECDFIFVPSIYSPEKKVYNCAKFIGLPDLMKIAAKEAPLIIDLNIDYDE